MLRCVFRPDMTEKVICDGDGERINLAVVLPEKQTHR
jgi:hypothetical protein